MLTALPGKALCSVNYKVQPNTLSSLCQALIYRSTPVCEPLFINGTGVTPFINGTGVGPHRGGGPGHKAPTLGYLLDAAQPVGLSKLSPEPS